MYEFDSVSVSSFEAAELAATLTEKSAEGWDVAGIVTAGSDVVAYLRRSTAPDAKEDDTVPVAVPAKDESSSATTSAAEPGTTEESEPEPSTSDLLVTDKSSVTGPADSGAAGWGSTTGSATAGGWGSDTTTTGSWGGAQQAAAPPQPQPQTPAVPAGWYADPAGRFELRYWDGGAWTEHVSRAGQQYTDPPVA